MSPEDTNHPLFKGSLRECGILVEILEAENVQDLKIRRCEGGWQVFGYNSSFVVTFISGYRAGLKVE